MEKQVDGLEEQASGSKLPVQPESNVVAIFCSRKRCIFDKEHKHKLFVRWDRIYINFSPEGNKLTGYWHINGHKPNITLLPHQEGEKAESWTIEVNKKELIMRGISDTNRTIERKYVRSNTF